MVLVLITLAVNGDDGIHSNLHTVSFPSETACAKAASILENISLSMPGSNGAKLITTTKCVQTGSRQ